MKIIFRLSGVLKLATLIVIGCNSEKVVPNTTDQKNQREQTEAVAKALPVSRVTVNVSDQGYSPDIIEAKAGERLVLVFKRTTEQGCGEELVFPDHNIRRSLPLHQEVEIELMPREHERITFTCGMGMYQGSVVATK